MTTHVAAPEARPAKLAATDPRTLGKPRFSALAHLLTWAFLTLVFTSLVVHYSLTRGKLIVPAHYDDVSYLRDGLDKLDGFYRAGFPGLLNRTLVHPPHSPWSTFVAFAGYAIFGIHDWAPYAANGIIIFALLGFVDYLTRGVRPWQKLAAFCFVLSIPIAAQCVYEFRSDMAVGLMTTIVIVLLIEQPLIRSSLQYRLLVGCILGFTLLSKTSIFPITLALTGTALAAASIRDRILLGREADLKSFVLAWGTMALPAILIPLPFYFRNRYEIYFYITTNALGSNSDIWTLHASRLTHLLYYSLGEGRNVMLGRHAWLLLAVVIVGLIGVLSRHQKPEVARAVCYLFMLAVAYAIPTADPIKDPYLGVVFDFLLIFASLLIFRDLVESSSPAPIRIAASAAAIVFVVAGLWFAKWPMYWGERNRPDVVTRNAYMNQLYQAIRSHDPTNDGTVMVGVTGVFANADALGYMADKDGLTSLHFVSDFPNKDLAEFSKQIDKSKFVVMGDPGNPEDDPNTPYTAMLDKTLPLVRSRPDLKLIATCPSFGGKNYYLYQRDGGPR